MDGDIAFLTANAIAQNLFGQINNEEHRYLLLNNIINHRINGTETKDDDAFIISSNGGHCRK